MILVLGGTVEGREIAALLGRRGYKVLLTVVSDYGAALAPPEPSVEVLAGKLEQTELTELISKRGVRVIIDATHPYAEVVTDNSLKAALETKTPYLRFERKPAADSIEGPDVYKVKTYEEAAETAMSLGNTVFLTIGSKNLEPFVKKSHFTGKRVVARVLPDAGVIQQCLELGLLPKDIIAVQGPFSLEMNAAWIREYGADVLVTKDSGRVGGTDTKVDAAARLKLPVVVISRPDTVITSECGDTVVLDDIDEIVIRAEMLYKDKV